MFYALPQTQQTFLPTIPYHARTRARALDLDAPKVRGVCGQASFVLVSRSEVRGKSVGGPWRNQPFNCQTEECYVFENRTDTR